MGTAPHLPAVAVLLVLGACAGEPGAGVLPRDAPPPDPGPIHVHGLGVNPADGLLYVATHTGLFRIPEPGVAERVGESYRDMMGFTVVGPDRFLASGHPDARDRDLPVLLGLMESVDGGETWEPRSLLGEADLHVLRHEHGRIYAYDSTGERVMTSRDGETWTTMSSLRLTDLTVHPEAPRALLAATPDGLRRSDDGGRSWDPVPGPGAPRLVLLAWEGDGLWGAAVDGTVFASEDEGRTWDRRGSLGGAPEALLAHEGLVLGAAHDAGILRSDDGGATWKVLFRRDPADPAE